MTGKKSFYTWPKAMVSKRTLSTWPYKSTNHDLLGSERYKKNIKIWPYVTPGAGGTIASSHKSKTFCTKYINDRLVLPLTKMERWLNNYIHAPKYIFVQARNNLLWCWPYCVSKPPLVLQFHCSFSISTCTYVLRHRFRREGQIFTSRKKKNKYYLLIRSERFRHDNFLFEKKVGESRLPWADVCLEPLKVFFQKVREEKSWIFYMT